MAWKHSTASLNRAPRYPARFCSLQCFGRIRFRGTLPSRRHSSVHLHSGDSLGTGAACAASVACSEEALLRREAASEAKPPKGPQGTALMRTECHAAFRAPLRALRFARALIRYAHCAGSLRNASRFSGAFGVPRKRIHPSARRCIPPSSHPSFAQTFFLRPCILPPSVDL